jgi:hypothetical protein
MNFITKRHLSRRTFLRGTGVTLALPFLESMLPAQTQLKPRAQCRRAGLDLSFFRTESRWTNGRRRRRGLISSLRRS